MTRAAVSEHAAPRIVSGIWRALLCLLASCPLAVHAHTTRLSSSHLTVSGTQVQGIVEVNGPDLEVALGLPLRGLGGTLAPALIDANSARLGEYLTNNLRFEQSGGKACPAELGYMHPKEDHLVAEISWRCPDSRNDLVYTVRLFQEVDPAARHMVTVTGDVRAFSLLGAGNARLDLRGTGAGFAAVLWRYLLAGVEHIAIGYDHIAFLIAVVLWSRRFLPLAAVVTAFTLAHSITLSLAVLDVVRLPPRLVELAIALSIVYVATENFFVRDIGRRWILTFLFGLIHGFGFASALREYGIPQDKVGWALAAFNVGVEIGQVAIVALAFAALLATDAWTQRAGERRRNRAIVWSISAGILLLALHWTWQRAAGWLS